MDESFVGESRSCKNSRPTSCPPPAAQRAIRDSHRSVEAMEMQPHLWNQHSVMSPTMWNCQFQEEFLGQGRSIYLHRRSGVISWLLIDCVHYVFDLAGVRMWLSSRGTGIQIVKLRAGILRDDLPIVEILRLDVFVVFNLPPFELRHGNFLVLVEKYGSFLPCQSCLSKICPVRLAS